MDPSTVVEAGSAMTTAFQSVAGSVTDGIASIAPIAIGVMGVMLVWRVGTRFFKSVAK